MKLMDLARTNYNEGIIKVARKLMTDRNQEAESDAYNLKCVDQLQVLRGATENNR